MNVQEIAEKHRLTSDEVRQIINDYAPTNIMQPPALKLDKVLYSNRPMYAHTKLERRIIWNLLHRLQAVGFETVAVDDGGEVIKVKDIAEAMEHIFGVDEARVIVKQPGKAKRSLFFVLGNGHDVLSDHSDPEDTDWTGVMDNFDPEEFE